MTVSSVDSRCPIASLSVINEWQRRIAAEYHSAAITQHLTLWLIQLGTPHELILTGLRIAEDELVHSRLSHEVVVAAGGSPTPLQLSVVNLSLQSHNGEALLHSVLRACVGNFCLGETVAVPLFKELRAGCTIAVARSALDRILRDEVRHRDFGWELLAWLLTTPQAPALRQQIIAELPGMFSAMRNSYAPESVALHSQMDEAERAWGLMPPALYRRALERAFERDYLPRFSQLQIDPTPAWQSSYERIVRATPSGA